MLIIRPPRSAASICLESVRAQISNPVPSSRRHTSGTVRRRHLGCRLAHGNTGAIDQHVETAVFAADLTEHALDLGRVGDIEGVGFGPAAGLGDRRGNAPGALPITIGDRDNRADPGIGLGDCAADAIARPMPLPPPTTTAT